MVVFAASLLGVVGTFNVIDGIAAVARSHVFIASAHYVIGDLRTWGWVALILGVLQLLAMLGPGRQPGSPLVRGGSDRAQRNRPDVLHPRVPVLVPVDRRRGRGGAVGTVRLRKPRENTRLTRPGQVVLLLTMSAATTPVTCPARPRANPVQAPH
jgi:hypothetical protein